MKNFLKKHKKTIIFATPIVLGLLYMLLCSLNLRQSIWFDEAFGAYLTRFSFADIWSLTAADVHPPFYYFLLKIWSTIFGHTDFAMRFMSVFFGAVAIVFAWHWLKHKFGTKPAALATFLMAISPMFVRYGQEMRMYTLAATIIFAATYVLQLAIDTKKRKYWLIYGALISLGMWTHYFVALVWLAQFFYLIYFYRKKILKNKDIIQSYILAVILYIPWLPVLIFQTGVIQSGFWIPEISISAIASYPATALLYMNADEVKSWFALLVLAALIALVFIVQKTHKKLTLLSFMALIPPILLILASMPPLSPVFVDRYIVYSAICLALLVGAGIMLIKFKKKSTPWIFSGLFILTSAVGLVNVYNYGNFNKTTGTRSDAKALFESITAISSDDAPIVSRSEWLYYDLSFYSNEHNPVYFVDALITYEWGSHEPLRQKDYGKIMDFDTFLDEHDTIWLVGNIKQDEKLDFKNDNYEILQNIYLDVNENQAGYRAMEVRKIPSV